MMNSAGRSSRRLVIALNGGLAALCVYLGVSMIAMNNERTLLNQSPDMTYTALAVLYTPHNPLWRDIPLRRLAAWGEPSPDDRAAEMGAARALDAAAKQRLRGEIADARREHDRLIAAGQTHEAAVALAPGIAAASRLDDLDDLERLVDLQIAALGRNGQR